MAAGRMAGSSETLIALAGNEEQARPALKRSIHVPIWARRSIGTAAAARWNSRRSSSTRFEKDDEAQFLARQRLDLRNLHGGTKEARAFMESWQALLRYDTLAIFTREAPIAQWISVFIKI